ncbi:IgGFc-binding protein-like [Aquila chrysaetos chrysaetos]|uniref:IgGFc-binding protein-like n=1 Tax=Aquila chrysaetos chrysaetos TaxID=223781 RepID=UPI001B7D41EF|nr:IgGFc-binding protein-like [Aquila chrysaetos chrysaetos]
MVETSPRCLPISQPPLVCHVSGRWRYRAFDGKNYGLAGACTQTLVTTCGVQLPTLQVTAGGQVGRGPAATFGHVTLRGYGPGQSAVGAGCLLRNGIQASGSFPLRSQPPVPITGEESRASQSTSPSPQVAGRRVRLPLSLAGGRVRLERRGGQRRVTTAAGVRVAFGGDGAVTVTAPASLRGQACGVCAQPEEGDGGGEGTRCPPPCSSKHPQEPCAPAPDPAPIPAPIPAPVPALATCSALGMGHLRTFDRLHRDFPVSCVYLLAGLCPGAGGAEPFRVLVRGGAGGIVGAEVLVHRTRVGLEPGQVTVNGVPTRPPHAAGTSAVTLEPRGWAVTVKTRRGVTVTFDGRHGRVRVQVPGVYGGRLCGLCGDSDGDPRNDAGPAGGGEPEGGGECGAVLSKEGPFRFCHGTVHPETYYRDCVADRCRREGACRVLAAYAAACQEAGKRVLEWRTEGFCPPNCPAGTRYSICAPGCTQGCREGCVPPPGTGGTQGCSVAPGRTPGVTGPPGTCRAVGTRHYLSFDGAAAAVGDNCSYVVARSCGPPGVHPAFDVTVTDAARGGSGSRRVTVTAERHRWVMRGGRPGVVEVDGVAVPLPFCLRGRAVCVTPRGAAALLLLADFGLRVAVGPGAAVAVAVSPRYRNVTCGLCGNFDGRPDDDIRLHDDDVAASGVACHRPCPGPACPPCRQPPERAFVHTELCGLLRVPRGPFGDCHAAVHPGIFFDVCLRELCRTPGDKEVLDEVLDEVLGAYEAACRQAGARVGPWRTSDICPPWCPEDSRCRPGDTCVPHRKLLPRDLLAGELLPLRGLAQSLVAPGDVVGQILGTPLGLPPLRGVPLVP